MNKKGFTLIELLAVIVILAIIALIAIPQITNVIEEARKGAAESSALGYIDAVEKYIMLHDVDSTKYPYDLRGKTLNVAKNTDISLLDIFIKRVYAESAIPSLNEIINPKGKKPTSGTIVVNEKGKVSNYAIIINKYKVKPKKDSNDNLIVEKPVARKLVPIIVSYNANGGSGTMADTVDVVATNTFTPPTKSRFKEWNTDPNGSGETYTSSTELEQNVTLYAIWESSKPIRIPPKDGETHLGTVYMNPKNMETKCSAENSVSTTGTKEGCMKFYIFDASNNNYTMILDHNTTSVCGYSSNNWNTSRGGLDSNLTNDTSGWEITARAITANEVATIIGKGSFSTSSATYTFGSLDQTEYPSQTSSQRQKQESYHWLFDYTNSCKTYGCKNEDNVTPGYWTQTVTSNSEERAWGVTSHGFLSTGYVMASRGSFAGIRPVVVVPKTEIQG